MGGLRDRITAQLAEERSSIDAWLTDYLLPANQVVFNGHTYGFGNTGGGSGGNELGVPGTSSGLVQSYDLLRKTKELASDMDSYVSAVKRCPPAFAAQVVRAAILSQARFTFRPRRGVGRKQRAPFGTNELAILETPWPGGTTGDLIAKMEWHAGLAGNSYVTRQHPLGADPRLRVLRPDWVISIYGSDMDADAEQVALAVDAELLGYLYCNGGFQSYKSDPVFIYPEDMSHWFPLPDPLCNSMGMSWITPAAREMQTDAAATEHKLNFFRNGATPNLVIKGLPGVSKKVFDDTVDMLEARHKGVGNAYKTLYLTGGADATVVGSTFAAMEFVEVIGQSETRISALSRVPAIMLGLSEGLKGAALNAGNFGQVRRMFADTWVFPQLQNLAASLAPLVNVPSDSELWFDVIDMPILREDATDAATILQIQGSNIANLASNGFTAESAVLAVTSNDMSLLKPVPGWISVQMQSKANAVTGTGANGGDSAPTDDVPPVDDKKKNPPPVVGKGK